jgi:uncharacterized membrane protein
LQPTLKDDIRSAIRDEIELAMRRDVVGERTVNRIFEKLDAIASSVSGMREENASNNQRLDHLSEHVNEHDERLRDIEKSGWKVAAALWGALVSLAGLIMSWVIK